MPRESNFTYFHEWDGLAEHWITSEESFDQDFPTKPFDPSGRSYSSVAEWVIEVIFGLTVASDSTNRGSTLPGYDIKSRDAYQMIQLSLATELAKGHLAECYADGNGLIHFYYIGESSSRVGASDIFYQINTTTLAKPCDNVLVTGYDPPPKRFVPSFNDGKFDLLRFFNIIPTGVSPAVDTKLEEDKDKGKYPIYHIWGDILGPKSCDYFKEAYIEYGDISLDQDRVLQKMGYLYVDKFETVSTYINKITVPFFNQASTSVKFGSSTPKFIALTVDGNMGSKPDMGKMQSPDWITQNSYVAELCRRDASTEGQADKGKQLPRSDEKKFLGVKDVYLYGYKLKQIQLDQYRDGSSVRDTKDGKFFVDLDTMLDEPFKLTRGQDYIIVDDSPDTDSTIDGSFSKIIFASNVHPNYAGLYGGSATGGDGVTIRISPASIYNKETKSPIVVTSIYDLDPANLVSGVLKDGVTEVDNQIISEKVIIFPLGDGQSGYVVNKIIVIYDWDNPCIAIYDENNLATLLNAESVSIDVYLMITMDEKPPIAWTSKGSTKLLDPTEVIPDPDVTTVQDLDSTEYARAFTSLETGDVKVTLPFLDAAECQTVASFIYDMQNEKIEQTTYTLSPDAEPILGELIDGKTINSIDYSYQDSSQYLISVNAGPRWAGISGWDTAVYQNKTERIQLEGIIMYVYPDNTKCQVLLEQLGMMDCINASKEILERGDRVAITVHNNPVAK